MNKEICICAAVMDETGYVWRGHRHADCIQLVIAFGRTYKESNQGFVTSKNRFVNRFEGYFLQTSAGIPSADKGGYRGCRLFSEDLY
jgi:hypothetical protein